MKKLLIAAGIGMCIFTMATTNTNAGSLAYSDLTQDTIPQKKDTTKPKKDDSLNVRVISPLK